MELTENQQLFIQRYAANKGDAYKTLESMRLELNHLLAWREDKYFDKVYRESAAKIIQQLNQENYILSVRKLNEVLEKGNFTESTTHTHKITAEGGEFEVKTQRKKLGIPIEAIKLAMRQSSLLQAIETLQNQGVLPSTIARKIMLKSDQIVEDMQNAFIPERRLLEKKN
jgi:hypothetical protein